MTIREVREEADQRLPEVTERVRILSELLLRAAAKKSAKQCVICRVAANTNTPHFVIPLTYIARCLVMNNLEEQYRDLPLRYSFLCVVHNDHFSSLFADIGDATLDIARLERRAKTLQAVQLGQLLVFGGPKALKLAQEFQVSVVALNNSAASRNDDFDTNAP